ncbi:hypothetical protein KSP40_PGU004942 [Platanthera guangdongensis]|uniref:RNase H type-1 domain-containing protein n=1 Tax=Platanthera guangdongensis TaxID=2320717 RepID=A0ABR2M887_9ASPA
MVELEAVLAIRRVVLPTLFEARGVIIEGDVANVIDFCRAAALNSARPSSLLPNMDLSFLSDFSAVRFQHVRREANKASHHCAQLAVSGDFLWASGPEADAPFLQLVAEDCRGLEGS